MTARGKERALRSNVRLLGDLLGRVLVEQEGPAFLELVEQVRALARKVRCGSRRPEELAAAIGGLGVVEQGSVLRAFGLFFQLANIAEQHHRLRRRREYEHEGLVPRESIADAVARLRASGVGDPELAAALARARHASSHGPSDRGDPPDGAHRAPSGDRSPARAGRSGVAADTRPRSRTRWPRRSPSCGRQTRSACGDLVWWTRSGTDYGSSRRALWDAVPELARGLRRELPGVDVPLRFGSWIGGDMDGNPNAGAETIEEALERARLLALERYRADIRKLGEAWGMSAALLGPAPGLPDEAPEPYRAELVRVWGRLADDDYADGSELLVDLRQLDSSLRARRGERIAAGALADVIVRAEVFGLHLAALDVRVHASEVRGGSERLRAALVAVARAQRRHGRAAVGRLIVSMTETADDVLLAEGLAAELGAEVEGVPLLETIVDLRGASDLVGELLDRRPRAAQEVMVGYTVIRALLAPALMKLLGEANWWMPKWTSTMLRVPHTVVTPDAAAEARTAV
jgi:phosphoenolpyruvate carboxylase